MDFNNELVILQQYKDLIDNNINVSQLNASIIITFVNEKFSEISGYIKEELIKNPHSIVRHTDVESSTFATFLWETDHIYNRK